MTSGDLRKVAAWFCQNSLLISPDKTKLLLIGTRQMLHNTPTDLDLHVTLLGKELRPVVSTRDLGVYMDATLSFYEHITSVTSSCLSSLIHKVSSSTRTRVFLNIPTEVELEKCHSVQQAFIHNFLLNQSDWSQLSYWVLLSLSISLFLSRDFFANDLCFDTQHIR